MRVRQLYLAAALSAAGITPGFAQTTINSNMSVSATVQSYCTFVTSPLAFGQYLPNAAKAASTAVSVTCTPGTNYSVGIGAGGGSAATTTTRKLTVTGGGSSTLSYRLFRDSGLTNNWGSTAGTDVLTSVGTGAVQAHTIYGQIPAAQYVDAGVYQDSVQVNVTYD